MFGRPARMLPDLSLYLVTDPLLCGPRELSNVVAEAVAGGVTLVQLRDKEASDDTLCAEAETLLECLRPLGIPLLINDRPHVAQRIGADGVHLGQRDMSPAAARELLGEEALLGVSVRSAAEALAIDPEVVDYAGVGPVFRTETKPGHPDPIGLEELARAVEACPVATVAVGGIGPEEAAAVMAAPVHGVAVISAIFGSRDPRAAAAGLRRAMSEGRA